FQGVRFASTGFARKSFDAC
ncbi:hypothetical protein A2U01_0111871, partial [Trifolium medium]|nr:hypothetical protein [Trifolium medium]